MTLQVVSGETGKTNLTPSEVEAAETKKKAAEESEAKRAAQFLASYQGKLCPLSLVSAGAPKQTGTLVAGLNGLPPPQSQSSEALGCQGPNCMWFLPVADEHGVVHEGGCVVKHVPVAISLLTNVVGQIGQAALTKWKK